MRKRICQTVSFDFAENRGQESLRRLLPFEILVDGEAMVEQKKFVFFLFFKYANSFFLRKFLSQIFIENKLDRGPFKGTISPVVSQRKIIPDRFEKTIKSCVETSLRFVTASEIVATRMIER